MTDRISPPLLAWGAATDAGLVRGGNEDSFVAEPMVFGVADGMGGHQAGEVASAIAANTLRDRLGTGAATVDVAVATVVEAGSESSQSSGPETPSPSASSTVERHSDAHAPA